MDYMCQFYCIMKRSFLLMLALSPMLAIAQPAAPPVEAAPLKSTTQEERFKEDWWKKRWEAKQAATKEAKRAKLVFLGDSITQGWEGGGKAVWEKEYTKYHPLNLGFSGDRTEHLLWRIKNDEAALKELKPEVAVIMIGTNNTGHNMRPAADTTAGIVAILDELKIIWPKTKFLVLSIFPRGADANDKARMLNDEINVNIAKLADNKTVFVQDISSSFLNADGTIRLDIMPDKLHPNTKGYELWAEAMKPKLKEMGL